MVRVVLNVLASAIMIGFLWGLREFLAWQGERFTIGFGAGVGSILAVLILYRRFIGPVG